MRNRKPGLTPVVKIIKYSRGKEVNEIKYKELQICTADPKNMIMLEDDSILKIHKIIRDAQTPTLLKVQGVLWEREKSLFQYPCDSSKLQMWELKKEPTKKILTCPVTSINNKLVKLSVVKEDGYEKFFVVGMLH